MPYATLAEICPADPTVTTPPQEQLHWEASSSALTSSIVTCAEPGVHGASTGTHGCGTSVPPELAAATWGFASDVHIPNGGTFSSATSVTTPAALVAEVSAPEAANVEGVVPNEHCRVAPVHTIFPMAVLPWLQPAYAGNGDAVVTQVLPGLFP